MSKMPEPPSAADLERTKLELEIQELKKPFWQRPGWVGAMVPIVIAICGVLVAWASGFLDRERSRLKQEKTTLQENIAAAETTLDLLTFEKERLKSQLAQTTRALINYEELLMSAFDASLDQLSRVEGAPPGILDDLRRYRHELSEQQQPRRKLLEELSIPPEETTGLRHNSR
jgi:hypothetical protein